MKKIDHYEILRELGRGGLGIVYLVKDLRDGQHYALKLAQKKFSSISLQRFAREREVLLRLQHPNIVSCRGFGTIQGYPYIIMDYVQGTSLLSYMQGKKLPYLKALVFMKKLIKALDYAHSQNIIHRDIKPSNIFINQKSEPILMDFGLAKFTDSQEQLTTPGSLVGTFKYMSPEQAQGDVQVLDARCDLYSLGCIFYELLTGTSIIPHKDPKQILQAVISFVPELPSSIVPEIPKAVDAICMKAITKDINTRYQSAAEFKISIDRFLQQKAHKNEVSPTREIGQPKKSHVDTEVIVSAELSDSSSHFTNEQTVVIANNNDSKTSPKQPTANVPFNVIHPSNRGMFAHYRLEGELGQGGMGIVYKAYDTKLQRTVALKLVLVAPGISDKQIKRFIQEARVMAQLNHPNIIRIFEVGESPSNYFTMEYIEGGTLSQQIKSSKPESQSIAHTIEQIAEALHYAHQKGILHRDIKPANIMLTSQKVAKLMDFGLAKIEDSNLSATEDLVGTPAYMSPEQAEGKELDERSDVYSLGTALYEALTGRPPFLGNSNFNIMQQVLFEDPLPPTMLNPDTPKDLEAICLKSLSKSPGNRYQSAEEFALDLRNFLDCKPIIAKHPNTVTRIKKFVLRHKTLSLATAFVFFILCIGIIFSAIQWQYASEAQRIAEEERDRARLAESETRQALEKAQKAEQAMAEALKAAQTAERKMRSAFKKAKLAEQKMRDALLAAQEATKNKIEAEVETQEAKIAMEEALEEKTRIEENAELVRKKAREALVKAQIERQKAKAERKKLEVAKNAEQQQLAEEIIKALQQKNYYKRRETVEQLQELPQEAFQENLIKALAETLYDDVPYIRRNSIQAFIRIAFSDFEYVRTKVYSDGDQTNIWHLLQHKQTGMQFVLLPEKLFLVSLYETPQKIWDKIMPDSNRCQFRSSDLPVENVSWEEVQKFCKKTGLEIPVFSQWQDIAPYKNWNSFDQKQLQQYWQDFAWCNSNSENITHSVGLKKVHPVGIYDVYGNVAEWCMAQSPSYIGGSWKSIPSLTLTTVKGTYRSPEVGFRCVKSVPKEIAEYLKLPVYDQVVQESDEEKAKSIMKAHPDNSGIRKIIHLDIKSLDLKNTKISNAGLSYLEKISGLEELYLDNTKIDNSGVQYLKNLKNLRVLSLSNVPIKDSGLEQLQNCKKLQELNLTKTQITSKGLSALNHLPVLEILHLTNTAIDSEGIKEIRNLLSLRELYLQNTKINNVSLSIIKKFRRLEVLNLNGISNITNSGAQNLARLKSLQRLFLNGAKINGSGMVYLKNLTQLKELYLNGTSIGDRGLAQLKNLKKIEVLSINSTGITDKSVRFIQHMAHLKALFIHGNRLAPETIKNLQTSLPKCRIVK